MIITGLTRWHALQCAAVRAWNAEGQLATMVSGRAPGAPNRRRQPIRRPIFSGGARTFNVEPRTAWWRATRSADPVDGRTDPDDGSTVTHDPRRARTQRRSTIDSGQRANTGDRGPELRGEVEILGDGESDGTPGAGASTAGVTITRHGRGRAAGNAVGRRR